MLSAKQKRTIQRLRAEGFTVAEVVELLGHCRSSVLLHAPSEKFQAYKYRVITPNGQKFSIRNLAEFCRLNELNYKNMQKVAWGLLKHYKQWKVIRLPS